MFRSIATGSSQPLAAGQTSHATGLVIRDLVGRDQRGMQALSGADPVRSALHQALRVERSRENLRAVGAALCGASPTTG
jgi:hypothetical protein